MRPLIGITTYGVSEYRVESGHYDWHYLIPEEYVASVRRAGGVPVLLPPGETELEPWVEMVDGIILAGGTDLDPARYGADPTDERVFLADLPRDETEFALTQLALDQDLPTLFVCRGLQVLNIVLGGTLHPHLPDVAALGEADIHRNEVGMWTTHAVKTVAGSRVATAMGQISAETVSGHHQGVDRVGVGLDVVGRAPDGLVEAVEVVDCRWAVGVQWHPELSSKTDSSQQGIFDGLVVAASES